MRNDTPSQREAFWTQAILILIGLGILVAVAFSGGVQSETVYLFVVGVAFFFIVVGILWHYKKQIGGLILIIMLLFLILFVVGAIAWALHLTAYAFDIGVVTILFIMTYAFWLDAEKIKSEWWKFVIFAILIYIFYSSGVLPSLNDTADNVLLFLRKM